MPAPVYGVHDMLAGHLREMAADLLSASTGEYRPGAIAYLTGESAIWGEPNLWRELPREVRDAMKGAATDLAFDMPGAEALAVGPRPRFPCHARGRGGVMAAPTQDGVFISEQYAAIDGCAHAWRFLLDGSLECVGPCGVTLRGVLASQPPATGMDWSRACLVRSEGGLS